MVRNLHREFIVSVLFCVCLCSRPGCAETGKMVVVVQNVHHQAVKGIEVGIAGNGGSGITGADGKIVLALGQTTREGEWVPLTIIHSPAGQEFVIFSPFDFLARVPSFADKAENVVTIFVMPRKDLEALNDGSVLAALTAKINLASKSPGPDDPKAALTAVAKEYGVNPEDLDRKIRAWGATTSDPYEIGLAALYERSYSRASVEFQVSLDVREKKLSADQKSVAADQKSVADAALFLGLSLYQDGKYTECSKALRRVAEVLPRMEGASDAP